MSEPAAAVARPADGDDVAALLGEVELFAGLTARDDAEFAAAFVRVELAAGEELWRQSDPVDGLHVLVEGEVQVCRRLPGQRELELARLGPGDVMGEVPLLGGGSRSATVRAVSACSLLFLDRAEFNAQMLSRRPGALELRRRIVRIACARLRRAHATLAASLGPAAGEAAPRDEPPPAPAELPPLRYLARLPLFIDLEAPLIAELCAGADVLSVPRGRVLLRAGDEPACCHVTLRGAVEEVLRGGDGMIRAGFAGPGRAFGYLGLLDGGPATATSIAREPSVVLAIGAAAFAERLRAEDRASLAFAAAVERDLIGTLRDAERPKAQLAIAAR